MLKKGDLVMLALTASAFVDGENLVRGYKRLTKGSYGIIIAVEEAESDAFSFDMLLCDVLLGDEVYRFLASELKLLNRVL